MAKIGNELKTWWTGCLLSIGAIAAIGVIVLSGPVAVCCFAAYTASLVCAATTYVKGEEYE